MMRIIVRLLMWLFYGIILQCQGQNIVQEYSVGEKITWVFTISGNDTVMLAKIDTTNLLIRMNYISQQKFMQVESKCIAIISMDRQMYTTHQYDPRINTKQPRLSKMVHDNKVIFAMTRNPMSYIEFQKICTKLLPHHINYQEIENGPNVSIIVRSRTAIYIEVGSPGDVIRPSEVNLCILRY